MARLILTNNQQKHQQAVARNLNAGFDDYISCEHSGITTLPQEKDKKNRHIIFALRHAFRTGNANTESRERQRI